MTLEVDQIMIGKGSSLWFGFVLNPDICFRIGFRYWKNPGPFVQYNNIPGATGRFIGWWSVSSQAAFSFIGTEIVAVSTAFIVVSRREIEIRGDHLDRRWRGQEPSSQYPQGYSRSLYPYTFVNIISSPSCVSLIILAGSIFSVSLLSASWSLPTPRA